MEGWVPNLVARKIGRHLCRRTPEATTAAVVQSEIAQMSALCTPRRTGRAPLRPVTPMGQDLPDDTPSKIRARNAAECAGIRRRQVRCITRLNTNLVVSLTAAAAGDPLLVVSLVLV